MRKVMVEEYPHRRGGEATFLEFGVAVDPAYAGASNSAAIVEWPDGRVTIEALSRITFLPETPNCGWANKW